MKLIVQWRGDLQKFTGTFPDGCGGVINADLSTGSDELCFKIGAFASHWGRGTAFDEVTIVRPTGEAQEGNAATDVKATRPTEAPTARALRNKAHREAQAKAQAQVSEPLTIAGLKTTPSPVTQPATESRETGSDPQA